MIHETEKTLVWLLFIMYFIQSTNHKHRHYLCLLQSCCVLPLRVQFEFLFLPLLRLWFGRMVGPVVLYLLGQIRLHLLDSLPAYVVQLRKGWIRISCFYSGLQIYQNIIAEYWIYLNVYFNFLSTNKSIFVENIIHGERPRLTAESTECFGYAFLYLREVFKKRKGDVFLVA